MAHTLREREGKLDVLVNNSGLGVISHRFEEFPLDDFDRLQAVNVRGLFALTRECLPLLEEGGKSGEHASVINIGSIDGWATAAVAGAAATSRSTRWPRGRSPACSTRRSRTRISTPPEDMAGVCIYLASRAGEYVTGVLLPVDGGVLVSRGANS